MRVLFSSFPLLAQIREIAINFAGALARGGGWHFLGSLVADDGPTSHAQDLGNLVLGVALLGQRLHSLIESAASLSALRLGSTLSVRAACRARQGGRIRLLHQGRMPLDEAFQAFSGVEQ